MLGEGPGAAAGAGDPAHLGPALRGVGRSVDPGAGGCVDDARRPPIEGQGHDVGIVDHPGVDRFPVAATVRRLPRQVPGPRVDGVGRARVDRDRIDVADLGVALGADPLPGLAGVGGAEHSLGRARHDQARLGISDGERPNALPRDPREHLEGGPAIGAPGDPASRATHFPEAHVEDALWIDHDVVQAHPALGKAGAGGAPAPARVLRPVKSAVGRAQVDDLRIARVGRERSHVAPGRAGRAPGLRLGKPGREQDEGEEDEAGGSPP